MFTAYLLDVYGGFKIIHKKAQIDPKLILKKPGGLKISKLDQPKPNEGGLKFLDPSPSLIDLKVNQTERLCDKSMIIRGICSCTNANEKI